MEVVMEVRENKKEKEEVIPLVKPIEEKNKKEAKLVIKLPCPLRATIRNLKRQTLRNSSQCSKRLITICLSLKHSSKCPCTKYS